MTLMSRECPGCRQRLGPCHAAALWALYWAAYAPRRAWQLTRHHRKDRP